jgi:exopolysaccharide biosynthesis polyprenyl glycosylphosphotransferase
MYDVNKNHLHCNDIANYLLDSEYGLYVQQYFNDMLAIERKRAERSKKCFVLMLISVKGIEELDKVKKVYKKIVAVLSECIRETDIKGWFQHNNIIGVIFTEIEKAANDDIKEIIARKIERNLIEALSPDLMKNVCLSAHIYPDECEQTDTKEHNLIFYPDVIKKLSSDNVTNSIKRFIDIVGSIFGIILFSPFFIIIPLCIKLTSKGTVLFKQERIGIFGRKFTFLKFRTMYVACDDRIHREYVEQFINGQKAFEKSGGNGKDACVFKIKNDPRITLIGKFLRRTSFDELPQFFNVLKGDMSLVGPRPCLTYECDKYDTWHKKRVLEIKPGITGLWQVKGRSSTNFNDMVRLDIQYIRDLSLWLDLKILLKTPWVIITGKGAY